MKFKDLICRSAFCLLVIPLLAEETAPPAVEVHLKLIAMHQPIMGYGYKVGKKTEPLVIAPDFFTPEITYRGPARFELLPYQKETSNETEAPKSTETTAKKTPEVIPDSKPAPEVTPLAWIDLPVSTSPQHLILLVDPTTKGEGGILAMPDQPGAFPYGSLRFMNFCPHPIEIRLHGQTITIQPKASAVIPSKASEGHYYEGAIYSLIDDKPTIAYNLRFFQQNDVRTLYFVSPASLQSPQVSLKGVEDRLTQSPPPSKGR
jgi:hypothetical protein